MDMIPPEKLLPLFAVIGIMIWACIGVWTWAGQRKRDGLPVLPVAWRRPVPWRGIDLLLFALIYLGSITLVGGAWSFFSDTTPDEISNQVKTELTEVAPVDTELSPEGPQKQKQHDLVLLLRSNDPWVLGFCFFMAVIFAPIIEEIIFRMLLQGYLEKIDSFLRRKRHRCKPQIKSQGSFSRILPWGVAPILVTSTFFAMLHFRSEKLAPSIEEVLRTFMVAVIAGTFSIVLLFVWLRTVRKARLADFGIVVREIPKDILRGTLAFFAVTPLVYGIQLATTSLVPKEIAPDPISIFFLSIAFGTVWCRTHRLVPSIVMHMCFNGFSLAMAVYLSR